MDPYERLGISRTSSMKELEQAYAEKLEAHPDESEERTEIERAYVVIKYEKKQKNKRNKRTVGIGALVLLLAAGGGTYFFLNQEETPQAVERKKQNASFVIGEEEKKSEEKTDSKSSQDPETQQKPDSKAVSEQDYKDIQDISTLFFRELEDALTDRSVKGLSVSTDTYNQTFQGSLNDLVTGGYIFDGELSVKDIPQNDITIKGDQATVKATVDYSSRSYQPYLHERPESSTIVWELNLVKSGKDWLVNQRKSLSDSADGRGMEVRESVKGDIIDTVHQHAKEWEQAYIDKDTSAFTLFTSAAYLNKQQSYYASMNKRGVYWDGYLDSVEYSPASITVSEKATDLSATVEALCYYEGDYYREEDDSLEESDPGEDIPFKYYLKYDVKNERWYIVDSQPLKSFSQNDTTTY
ncbi:hypothetical protein AS033_00850 [Exiguobacterium indicum]|uniref:J domain-containing protein n=1 Tax=Exiguobacterium indicum TaxID=296995 RepID=A0A0V8GI61_9BACL|nr:hypothetical protein [Exiguobacterium enclense]KSU49947.1 hypothetical protein AS033_00850 [Exiguobacterium enclense]SDB86804.1 hypothetical protein SAMN05216342_0173 [Exiguobacterium enclense]